MTRSLWLNLVYFQNPSDLIYFSRAQLCPDTFKALSPLRARGSERVGSPEDVELRQRTGQDVFTQDELNVLGDAGIVRSPEGK